MQQNLWIAVAMLLAVAAASGVAEHRRRRRRDLDKVGVVPWPAVQFAALLGAVLTGAIALRAFG